MIIMLILVANIRSDTTKKQINVFTDLLIKPKLLYLFSLISFQFKCERNYSMRPWFHCQNCETQWQHHKN